MMIIDAQNFFHEIKCEVIIERYIKTLHAFCGYAGITIDQYYDNEQFYECDFPEIEAANA